MSKRARIIERLKVLEAKFGKSGNSLGKEAGLANGTVDGWTDNQVDKPNLAVEKFLTHFGISETWWKSGNGEVFVTSVHNGATVTGNPLEINRVYKELVEGNSEYSLIPKTVIAGEYRLMLDKDLDFRMQIISSLIETKNETIKDLRTRLERAERDLDLLRSPQSIK